MPLAVTNKGVIIFNEDYKIENWIAAQQVFYPELKPMLINYSETILIWKK